MKKKHVIFIIADQMRYDCTGHAGVHDIATPNIDSLASTGITYTRAYTPAPLCGPARCSLFTGLYPHQAKGILLEDPLGVRTPEERPLNELTDMLTNDSSLREPPLLTNLLKDAGYSTAYAGKWHLGNDCINQWFDIAGGYETSEYIQWLKDRNLPIEGWPLLDNEVRTKRSPHMSIPKVKINPLEPQETCDAWIADIAIDMIRKRNTEKPLFLVCGFNGPHPPFKVPEPYFSMYDPQQYDEPPNFNPTQGEPSCKEESFYRLLRSDHGDQWEHWKRVIAVYHGFCTLIDDQVGRIVSCLKQEGMFDDTLIVFTSDHGEQLGQHGLWHKMQPYEESVRVPLVASIPWEEHLGITVDTPVSLIDIPSAMLSAADCEIPETYQGQNMFGPLQDRRMIFMENQNLGTFHNECDWRAVTDGRYKFVLNHGDANELYDLELDPYETFNLAGNEVCREIQRTLADELAAWMHETHDPLAEIAVELSKTNSLE